LLGSKSNGLTDVDLDSPEAVKIADYFLPETEAVFGRAGKTAFTPALLFREREV
jgi:hypothetical protein